MIRISIFSRSRAIDPLFFRQTERKKWHFVNNLEHSQFFDVEIMRNSCHHSRSIAGVVITSTCSSMVHSLSQSLRIAQDLRIKIACAFCRLPNRSHVSKVIPVS